MSVRRTVTAIAIAGIALVAMAVPALAHITVHSDDPTQGAFAELTFRVPNEEDSANTTSVDVQLPTDTPFANVSVKPTPGWTAAVKKTTLATPITDDDGNQVTEVVSEVTWTGGTIEPGEFEEFELSVGPLPDAGSVRFPTVQTYDDGDVVSWIEDTPAGGPEPEHPTPVLELAKAGAEPTASSSEASSGSSSTPSVTSSAAAPTTTTVKEDADQTLALFALLVAAVALIAAIGAIIRSRTSS